MKYLFMVIFIGLLSSCGGGSSADGGVTATAITTGSVSGRLFSGPTPVQTVIASGAVPKTVNPVKRAPDFVIGEAMVQFKIGSNLKSETARVIALFASFGMHEQSNMPIVHAVTFSSNIANNYRKGLLSRSEAEKKTLAWIAQIKQDTHVQLVSLNHIHKKQVVPNDPKYSQQWNYPIIGLEQAWDITKGSANVIVAVLDTGIFPHPDLKANVIAGYDFVSNITSAGDGNGIDPDPTAVATPKDDATHGTHVAGTIAAASNNRIGVAGVAWLSKIMPIRVLGSQGGSDSDIINGIAYAARLANASGTLPVKRADIINMSLGGIGSVPLFQQAIDIAVAAGVTIIAAAGNSALDGNPINYPCAYNNVICVGAVAPDLKRATYSEFNAFIDVVAPGGEQALGLNAGILSTTWKNGALAYEKLQGTSMACPHVAGVAALMLAANSTLTPAKIGQMLTSTAWDLGAIGKDNNFGFGMVNAYQAVALAKGLALTGSALQIGSNTVYLNNTILSTQNLIRSIGGGAISAISATPDKAWLTATLNQSTAPATLRLTASGVGQTQTILKASVSIVSSAGNKTVQVFFDNRPALDPGIITIELADLYGTTVATTTTSKAKGFAYSFNNIAPGDYLIAAGLDRDGSGNPTDNWGEYFGTYPLYGTPNSIRITAGINTSGINFQLLKTDDMKQFDGNGGGAVRGTILANVKDDQGNPIAGAKVYIGNGSVGTGTSNALGRTTIFGGFNGAQTVTATAPGYTTLTYWQSNASYLTFPLSKLTTAKVPLNITLTGLTVGETVVLFADDSNYQPFPVTATSMTFNLTQSSHLPFAISAITYNALGKASLYGSNSVPAGIVVATNLSIAMTPPFRWGNITGNIVNPTGGNFSLAGLTYAGFGLTYLGLFQPILFNGYQSIANTAAVNIDMAATNVSFDPYGNVVGIIAVNALGESSMAMQLGSLSVNAATALPTNATVNLIDVPALIAPVNTATGTSTTPTLTWNNTFSPSLQSVNIQNPVTQKVLWEIDVPSNVRTVTLPNIPTGGLKTLSNYQWNVDNRVIQNFNFNQFDANKAMQSTSDFSESQIWGFKTL